MAGDFICISGGLPEVQQLILILWSINNVHGSPDKPVTIAVNSTDPKHNGIVIFDYDAKGDTARADGLLFSNNSFITLTGNVNGQNHIVFKKMRKDH